LHDVKVDTVKVGPLNCAAISTDGQCYVWGFSFHHTPTLIDEVEMEDGIERAELPDTINLVAIGMNELVIAS
jgi:hypothetical protein